MARPHIEFIQSQVLSWQKGLPGGHRTDVDSKILSLDPDGGGASLIVRYPPGWRREAAEHFGSDEEIFVLDGALTMGAHTYRPHHYAFLPAGTTRETAAAPDGAVVLTFYSGPARPVAGRGNGGDARRLVSQIDTYAMPWDVVTGIPNMRAGIARRVLRVDPDTGERTWMLNAPPGGRPEGQVGPLEIHPVVEEMFLLEGVMHTERGVMHPGAYFWRPPQEPHGPAGSRTGNLILFRCIGGPLDVLWSEKTIAFRLDPPHDPILPPDLRVLGGVPVPPTTLY